MWSLSQGLAGVGLRTSRPESTTGLQVTGDTSLHLPANLLDVFIPGYSAISRGLYEAFGFDITKSVSVTFLGYALAKAISFLSRQAQSLVMQHLTCSVNISSDVDSYAWVMDWLASRGVGEKSHRLVALPVYGKPSMLEMFRDMADGDDGSSKTRKGTKTDMRYQPDVGQTHYFWHKRRLFCWMRRERQQTSNPLFNLNQNTIIDGQLYCLGRSTLPIKELLKEVFVFNQEKTALKTVIRRPAPEKQRHMGGNPWKKAATRPSRSMNTVVLGDEQKSKILQDIEEYLLPETRQWYAQRGIPYRRGYLFYGPPGTGKTSLSFALAGVFDLDVYCMSLQDPTITEEDLATLFDKLPEQCLVLLEDIDSAGLIDRKTALPPPPKPKSEDGDDEESKPKRPKVNEGHISLSGLLNIIDGVASHEGRVLIMTTNHIEKLDNALLRPGRIDVRIQFELATKLHAETLFLQIFSAAEQISSMDEAGVNGSVKEAAKEKVQIPDDLDIEELRKMAKEFAQDIPDRKISPAELQGFLINWKKSPRDAVSNAKTWVEGTLATSNRG
ncbi:P-loop containing nucleoside triphosphate hydrolase protein [Bisporella sp. PMI_857]|nr:P-loop containing nucleoside triphosphate hydrolase protein [Bisporella sp. PMI_857]